MKVFVKCIILCLVAAFASACGAGGNEEGVGEFGIRQLNEDSPDSDQYVLIETNRGNIKLLLYKETPLHRKNFVNLVKNGYYNGQLFFRIKKNFMIQAGDPTSRNAKPGQKLGETDVSYKIPAEIDPTRFWHKYGALSAASLNPAVESSGSHFYIITGNKVKDSHLNNHEKKYNKTIRRQLYEELQKPYQDKINKLHAEAQKSAKKKREFNELFKFFSEKADSAMVGREFSFSPEQRNHYKEVGGAFHLDGYYTVFGEVLEGMDIVEAVSLEAYDVHDRPVKDVVIKRITLLENENANQQTPAE
ncbi:MAG: peptidylprolyl isomerase [Bacteroidaceae bacterium]|nr:peptidylprolyl isomerase [Bacteroidaceae bacterium]